MNHILVIDDDLDICLLLDKFLSKKGFSVSTAYSGKSALEKIPLKMPDVVLCDFRLEDMNGGELLEKIHRSNSHIPVIIMTGYSDVRTAVNMMRLGAADYVTKPLLPEEILLTLNRALNKVSTQVSENDEQKNNTPPLKYVVGKSPAFNSVMQQINLVAPTNFSVIIYGESGSGKESVANEIHNSSMRAHKPFVAIDCGSLSKELAGSELFGHEKGSFTGAFSQKTGSFELANGGTIFLDEIGNLSYDIQVALLRVVQERKIRRIGGTKDIDLDVRLIVASNERLAESVQKGKFREDLYHRFNEFSVEVPPLRHRREDLLQFAEFFLEKTNKELNKNVKGFSNEVIEIFHRYKWHGNLRELHNVIKRSTLLTSDNVIEVQTLPFEIVHSEKLNFENAVHNDLPLRAMAKKNISERKRRNGEEENISLFDEEFKLINEALKKSNYNKSKAAKLLNIDRKTLYNKLEQYNHLKGEA